MLNQDNVPMTAEEYIDCVRKLGALLDKAIDTAASTEFVSTDDRSYALNRLAEGVETVACLRGDSEVFSGGRPANVAQYQKEMYQIENDLRKRLISLGYTYPQR